MRFDKKIYESNLPLYDKKVQKSTFWTQKLNRSLPKTFSSRRAQKTDQYDFYHPLAHLNFEYFCPYMTKK